MDLLFLPALVFGVITGLAIGSFLNVVIYRVPRDMSISRPPSHCPACDRRILWYENVPLLSWLVLRGKCRTCRAPISIRYPIVEALGGAAAAVAVLRFGVAWEALAGMILGWHLIALAFIDFDTRLLPDSITFSLAAFGLPLAFLSGGWYGLLMGVLSAGILAGFFWLIGIIAKAWLGREALGEGDILLVGAIGLFLHPLYLPLFLLFASVIALMATLIWATVKKTDLHGVEIPFAPSLAVGGWVTFHFGSLVMEALMRLAGAMVR